jgi:hypothetical protein
MLEDPTTPTFLGLNAMEWHSFGYGLKDGLKVWKRTHIKYSEIDALDVSPEIKEAIKKKFHYYEIGSDLPEDIVLLVAVGWFVWTDLPSAMKLAGSFFGIGG